MRAEGVRTIGVDRRQKKISMSYEGATKIDLTAFVLFLGASLFSSRTEFYGESLVEPP